MRFRPAMIEQLAQMICGDARRPFPYRSSSLLTSFFTGLGLDFVHNGESRGPWTRTALNSINLQSPEDGDLPSKEMASIIEEVVNRQYFDRSDYAEGVNHEEALRQLNRLLDSYRLEVIASEDSSVPTLRKFDCAFISTSNGSAAVSQKITFTPSVFKIPRKPTERDLVAVMMPFSAGFTPVFDAIKNACTWSRLRCNRADDIWNNSVIIQDIFDLLFVASIVVVDFTGKNPNVMYETGIAHTLGKEVIPITQSIDDIPFDMKHHRVLKYHDNREGLLRLEDELGRKLWSVVEALR